MTGYEGMFFVLLMLIPMTIISIGLGMRDQDVTKTSMKNFKIKLNHFCGFITIAGALAYGFFLFFLKQGIAW
ncbi:hypothetical protein PQC07_gp074 [Aeromonas phage D3]|uniref:Uncharacterized protein n=2 Tax=Ludhianavirus TaxID=3044751 RepID=A0A514TV85_9CAUD|nr:hypothetical protein PQC07_gp074 [Aeromonas phage D3]YP_010668949.1 hypothetical protein PQC08_gp074 [Aeromonas phage D6]QDJ96931.1 hypothetical protein D3_0201 [Aeromonas phage D3]QDJ97360.1 hypothetical protein D6_0201 [Aeromonas phage D6]QEP52237.1 hypothetical protein D9_0030 [Aeromonas phage D9]